MHLARFKWKNNLKLELDNFGSTIRKGGRKEGRKEGRNKNNCHGSKGGAVTDEISKNMSRTPATRSATKKNVLDNHPPYVKYPPASIYPSGGSIRPARQVSSSQEAVTTGGVQGCDSSADTSSGFASARSPRTTCVISSFAQVYLRSPGRK